MSSKKKVGVMPYWPIVIFKEVKILDVGTILKTTSYYDGNNATEENFL